MSLGDFVDLVFITYLNKIPLNMAALQPRFPHSCRYLYNFFFCFGSLFHMIVNKKTTFAKFPMTLQNQMIYLEYIYDCFISIF